MEQRYSCSDSTLETGTILETAEYTLSSDENISWFISSTSEKISTLHFSLLGASMILEAEVPKPCLELLTEEKSHRAAPSTSRTHLK
jgi:hypothetical protein